MECHAQTWPTFLDLRDTNVMKTTGRCNTAVLDPSLTLPATQLICATPVTRSILLATLIPTINNALDLRDTIIVVPNTVTIAPGFAMTPWTLGAGCCPMMIITIATSHCLCPL